MNRTAFLIAALALTLAAGVPAGAQEPASFEPCSGCHDDLSQAFHANPHAGAMSKGLTTACESCHGDGTAHAESGDPELISVPRGDKAAAACLSCHAGQAPNAIHARGAHGKAGVSCESCHAVHGAPDRHALLAVEGSGTCVTCHLDARSDFHKPFGHRLDLADSGASMTCYSCHDPHGAERDLSLKTTAAGETACVGCHTELRGPFVFPHVSSHAGDCRSCHEPHGSNNPRALARSRVDRLCLECHSPVTGTTLGSQPPSFHDLRSPRYLECTTCHVAVHGSMSSPALLR